MDADASAADELDPKLAFIRRLDLDRLAESLQIIPSDLFRLTQQRADACEARIRALATQGGVDHVPQDRVGLSGSSMTDQRGEALPATMEGHELRPRLIAEIDRLVSLRWFGRHRRQVEALRFGLKRSPASRRRHQPGAAGPGRAGS